MCAVIISDADSDVDSDTDMDTDSDSSEPPYIGVLPTGICGICEREFVLRPFRMGGWMGHDNICSVACLSHVW